MIVMDWEKGVQQLKAKAQEFVAMADRVKRTEQTVKNDPKLYAEFLTLNARADAVRETIQKVTGGFDKMYGYVRDKLGLGEMGILPIIPIAVSGAAIAAITKFTTDAVIYLKKVEKLEQLAPKIGYEKAAKVVNDLDNRGLNLGANLTPLIGFGLAVMVLPQLLKGK